MYCSWRGTKAFLERVVGYKSLQICIETNVFPFFFVATNMEQTTLYGTILYKNFPKILEKHRKGQETHILREIPNGWRYGALFHVRDSSGKILVCSELGSIVDRVEEPSTLYLSKIEMDKDKIFLSKQYSKYKKKQEQDIAKLDAIQKQDYEELQKKKKDGEKLGKYTTK